MATSILSGGEPVLETVPGLLPGPGKQWADHLFFHHPQLHILLQPGHQGEGNFSSREDDQEEKTESLNTEEKPSKKRTVHKKENCNL